MNAIAQLHALGQSLWYDNIQRSLLVNGELAAMIHRGDIRGVTSNPSIFNNAISKTKDYDEELYRLAEGGHTAEQIFYQLAVEDIRAATDLFAPLYKDTDGGDGYVSLEVSPYLANDTAGTIAEAKKLWVRVDRPNLMIKVPATLEGLPAITELISSGLNVNVTLIFSLERYAAVIEAYLKGLEQRIARGDAIFRISSVASFFVSRVDSKADARLAEIVKAGGENAALAKSLMGKAAIANAKLAYDLFETVVNGARFKALEVKGARRQRPLWASTSTKNPDYRDVLYAEELIGPDTVDTAPPQTIDAFRDHGVAALTLTKGMAEARQVFSDLDSLGISIDEITNELEIEGVKSFADAYTTLLGNIEQRVKSVKA